MSPKICGFAICGLSSQTFACQCPPNGLVAKCPPHWQWQYLAVAANAKRHAHVSNLKTLREIRALAETIHSKTFLTIKFKDKGQLSSAHIKANVVRILLTCLIFF
jgi:hypothetical protein